MFHRDAVVISLYPLNIFRFSSQKNVTSEIVVLNAVSLFHAILFALHCNAIFPVVGIPRTGAPPAYPPYIAQHYPHIPSNIYLAHVLFVYETVQCVCGQSDRMPVSLISVLKRPRRYGEKYNIFCRAYNNNNDNNDNNIYYSIVYFRDPPLLQTPRPREAAVNGPVVCSRLIRYDTRDFIPSHRGW